MFTYRACPECLIVEFKNAECVTCQWYWILPAPPLWEGARPGPRFGAEPLRLSIDLPAPEGRGC